MSKSQKKMDEMSFEEAFTELETLVQALEDEGRALEDAIGLYERGQLLARYCAAMLEKAELKVRMLNGEIFENEG
jgi:exodeoxyribonuclease VII small subunit